MTETATPLTVIGWREWVALPGLGIDQLKAKIDTGARTSALHAYIIEPYSKGNKPWVMFIIHPKQQRSDISVECHAPVKDRRQVSDSGGHKQYRYVIETQLLIGDKTISSEITLTNRDTMLFRMLVGRTALNSRFIIDPQASYLLGKPGLGKP